MTEKYVCRQAFIDREEKSLTFILYHDGGRDYTIAILLETVVRRRDAFYDGFQF